MMKWLIIIAAVILLGGGLILSGMLEIAAGAVKLAFFLIVALVAAIAYAVWRGGKKLRHKA